MDRFLISNAVSRCIFPYYFNYLGILVVFFYFQHTWGPIKGTLKHIFVCNFLYFFSERKKKTRRSEEEISLFLFLTYFFPVLENTTTPARSLLLITHDFSNLCSHKNQFFFWMLLFTEEGSVCTTSRFFFTFCCCCCRQKNVEYFCVWTPPPPPPPLPPPPPFSSLLSLCPGASAVQVCLGVRVCVWVTNSNTCLLPFLLQVWGLYYDTYSLSLSLYSSSIVCPLKDWIYLFFPNQT